MGFLIGLMTVVLALDCVFLILLILIQLPKKEAGMGTAFGGQATDALFGSGTGNALTRITKYAATLFFVFAIVLAILNANRSQSEAIRVKEALKKQASSPIAEAVAAATAPQQTNLGLALPKTAAAPLTSVATNAPAAPAPAATVPATNKGGAK